MRNATRIRRVRRARAELAGMLPHAVLEQLSTAQRNVLIGRLQLAMARVTWRAWWRRA